MFWWFSSETLAAQHVIIQLADVGSQNAAMQPLNNQSLKSPSDMPLECQLLTVDNSSTSSRSKPMICSKHQSLGECVTERCNVFDCQVVLNDVLNSKLPVGVHYTKTYSGEVQVDHRGDAIDDDDCICVSAQSPEQLPHSELKPMLSSAVPVEHDQNRVSTLTGTSLDKPDSSRKACNKHNNLRECILARCKIPASECNVLLKDELETNLAGKGSTESIEMEPSATAAAEQPEISRPTQDHLHLLPASTVVSDASVKTCELAKRQESAQSGEGQLFPSFFHGTEINVIIYIYCWTNREIPVNFIDEQLPMPPHVFDSLLLSADAAAAHDMDLHCKACQVDSERKCHVLARLRKCLVDVLK